MCVCVCVCPGLPLQFFFQLVAQNTLLLDGKHVAVAEKSEPHDTNGGYGHEDNLLEGAPRHNCAVDRLLSANKVVYTSYGTLHTHVYRLM